MTTRWLYEEVTKDFTVSYSLKKIFYEGQSEFQAIDVVELGQFGRSLILDGKIQSCETDETVYHESLVHPPLFLHPNPKTVFIAGGGEGATAREVLRHKSVEKVVMVDIDGMCVSVCKQHLPNHSAGAFDNPRLELVIQDAKQYLVDYQGTFDVVICDLADPLEDGPCYLLYTEEFYTMVASKLAPNGIFITQSGPAGSGCADEVTIPVYNTLKKVFKNVTTYLSYVPSFMDIYSFGMASNDIDVKALPSPALIDQLIEERIDGRHESTRKPEDDEASAKGSALLKFYDGETHQMLLSIPKYLRELMKKNNTIITDAAPRFFTHG